MARADAGFTLIEALVAMAVLAVAAAGLVRATAGHIDTIAGLEARAAAGWAAENRLAETRLGQPPAVPSLLGRDWQTDVAAAPSADPDIAALTVTAGNGGVVVRLRGFRDTIPPPPAEAADAAGPAAAAASSGAAANATGSMAVAPGGGR